jgi:hypothetical protein
MPPNSGKILLKKRGKINTRRGGTRPKPSRKQNRKININRRKTAD